MRSSYKENNYGNVLTALVIGKRPEMCVELGVLDGYSAIHIGYGLKFNYNSLGIDGRLYCFDLWDMYPYKHGNINDVQSKIDEENLDSIISLHHGDAFDVPKMMPQNSVDFLHVDISNDGETLEKIMQIWDFRIKPFGIIVFEGGSQERDQVEWMIKYNKKPIFNELRTNKTIKESYKYFTFSKFPSMTILQKKGCFT